MSLLFEDICLQYPEKVSELAFLTRAFLFKHLPNVAEITDDTANFIGYGFGSRYKDILVTMIFSKKGLKLGFNKGASFPDPDKLLKGSGKVHKYAELRSADDLSNPALLKLLNEALRAYREQNNK